MEPWASYTYIGNMVAAEAQGDNLTDDELQSEIELVGDLVVAATSSDGPMPQDQIDQLLGIRPYVDGPERDEPNS
jgi:hypothetical protein